MNKKLFLSINNLTLNISWLCDEKSEKKYLIGNLNSALNSASNNPVLS